jgi:L,D-transpeptidase ErfK/SrfK
MNIFLKTLFLLTLASISLNSPANSYPLPPIDSQLIGQIQTATARHEDTLLDIARRYDIGQKEILLVNKKTDRWLPGEGTKVIIPSRFILPKAPRRGIVLNVPEMRLYQFQQSKNDNPATVTTHPVSIGRMDWTTPLGKTRIIQKKENPTWRPPESIKKEHAEKGEILPDVVPAGPDNPLGLFALRLGIPGYLIHSTNKPFGVGMRVSHGCVRMYPEDIEKLFQHVKVGTPVLIINQPIKVGWFANKLYIEVHPALDEETIPYEEQLPRVLDLIEEANNGQLPTLDGFALKGALTAQSGIPVQITK